LELGFNSLKDVLDIVIIPLVLTALALALPAIQAWYRQLAFRRLILRELEELKPYPACKQPGKNWWDHQKRTFIHQKIFQNPTENRDFILSLDPELVYFVTQLWDALERQESDGEQWLWYLENIRDKYDRNADIKEVYNKWKKLIYDYNQDERKS